MREERFRNSRRLAGWMAAGFFAVSLMMLAACNKPAAAPQVKRFHLQGKIISIDAANNSLTIAHDAIPGFMDAMTMPYSVKSAQSLAGLNPGDEITADVVVPEDSSVYVENIVVTQKSTGAAAAPKGISHHPKPGEKVPDFAFLDQDGKRIHLSSFRGSPLLVTFIYTRCPYPQFCPLVSKGFAKIYAATRASAAPGTKIRLLSVSFDPENDTPEVLRKFAETFKKTADGPIFDRWEFAAAPRDKLNEIADFFGLYIEGQSPVIVHSMSTTVISPEGTVYSWYDNSDWQPAQLIADATASTEPSSNPDSSTRAQVVASASQTRPN
jgi:protein SCO1